MDKNIKAIKSEDSEEFAVARVELISLLFKMDQALLFRNRLKIQPTTMAAELRAEYVRNATDRDIVSVNLEESWLETRQYVRFFRITFRILSQGSPVCSLQRQFG